MATKKKENSVGTKRHFISLVRLCGLIKFAKPAQKVKNEMRKGWK